MSYSRSTYSGGATPYAVTFPYITRSHVRVYVDNLLYTGTVTFLSDTSVDLSPDAASTAVVQLRRVTPTSTSLVAFHAPVAAPDLVKAKQQALYCIEELTDAGGGGSGPGGPVDWTDIQNKPSVWPGTIPFGNVTGISALTSWVGTTSWARLLAIPAAVAALTGSPASGQVFEYTGPTTGHFIATPAGGGGGAMQPRQLSDYGTVDSTGASTAANDAAIAAAEAATDSKVYLRDGIYAKTAATPMGANLTKGYKGTGIFLEGTNALPANFRYMAVKPTTWPVQGIAGWFRGDQRFTENSYHILGPDVRTFDVTSRYYESNTMPNHHWWDVNSGNTGINAFLTSGANPGMGTVIPLPYAADASWVGKTVAFASGPDGAALETRTVTAVNTAGNNITINAAVTNTYTWNPGGNQVPCIYFGHRTGAPHKYVKITAGPTGGGDVGGTAWRTNNNYVPKASEYHTFMTCTTFQCGGDQYAGASGVYLNGWESQMYDKPGGTSFDIAALAFVQSFIRTNDTALDGGKVWGGTLFKSTGTRPADFAHNIIGAWRNGIDAVISTFIETTRLTVATTAGGSTIQVASLNGCHHGDTITIGEPGAVLYTGIIGTFSTGPNTITLTTTLPGSVIGAGQLVTYTQGGAFANLYKGSRIVWNSSYDSTHRSGDPSGAFATSYGNIQGDLIEGSGADVTSDFWSIRFARGVLNTLPDTARLRLRPDGVQVYGNFNMTGNFAATGDVACGSGARLAMGSGIFFIWDGTNVKGTKNGGSTYTILF